MQSIICMNYFAQFTNWKGYTNKINTKMSHLVNPDLKHIYGAIWGEERLLN